MAEYIEKKALMVALCKEIIGDGDYYNGKDDMQDQIRDMVSRFPAADVAPVRHGRWVLDEKRYVVYCSECSEPVSYYPNIRDVREENHYCPNCGAKMDLEV